MAKPVKNVPQEFDHLAMVKDKDRWPCWPYLPVKRRDKNGWQWGSIESKDLGVLWVGTNGMVVHHAYLFQLPATAKEFMTLPKTEYKSHEDMLADGWEVD